MQEQGQPLFLPSKEKIKWENIEQDDMGEHDISAESADGKFAITPNYYDKENAQDFTIEHAPTGIKETVDTFAQAKKLAQEWQESPPLTKEQKSERNKTAIQRISDAELQRGLEMFRKTKPSKFQSQAEIDTAIQNAENEIKRRASQAKSNIVPDISGGNQGQFLPKQEAEKLGLQSLGEQHGLHWFNDPLTKSTITIPLNAKEGELEAKIKASREKFAAGRFLPREAEFGTNAPEGKAEMRKSIESLRPSIAQKAQEIYDAWKQDHEGVDEEFGTGGICDAIANEISSELASRGYDVVEGGQAGDDHAFVIAHNGNHAFVVDIPPNVYESGGGYSWKKKEGVKFADDHVEVDEFPGDIQGLIDEGDFFGGSFLPAKSKDPKAVASAAMRFPDGKVFSSNGPMHWLSLRPAYEHYGAEKYDAIVEKAEKGWLTNEGEFLPEEEARQRAVQQRQVDEKTLARIDKETGGPVGFKGLESISFEKAKREKSGPNFPSIMNWRKHPVPEVTAP